MSTFARERSCRRVAFSCARVSSCTSESGGTGPGKADGLACAETLPARIVEHARELWSVAGLDDRLRTPVGKASRKSSEFLNHLLRSKKRVSNKVGSQETLCRLDLFLVDSASHAMRRRASSSLSHGSTRFKLGTVGDAKLEGRLRPVAVNVAVKSVCENGKRATTAAKPLNFLEPLAGLEPATC